MGLKGERATLLFTTGPLPCDQIPVRSPEKRILFILLLILRNQYGAEAMAVGDGTILDK